MSELVVLTAENYAAEVTHAVVPVCIDFWAEWCGPCKAYGPMFEAAAAEQREVKFVKLNTDEQPALAKKFNVSGIPATVLLRGGDEVARFTGARPTRALTSWLEAQLRGGVSDLDNQVRLPVGSELVDPETRVERFILGLKGLEPDDWTGIIDRWFARQDGNSRRDEPGEANASDPTAEAVAALKRDLETLTASLPDGAGEEGSTLAQQVGQACFSLLMGTKLSTAQLTSALLPLSPVIAADSLPSAAPGPYGPTSAPVEAVLTAARRATPQQWADVRGLMERRAATQTGVLEVAHDGTDESNFRLLCAIAAVDALMFFERLSPELVTEMYGSFEVALPLSTMLLGDAARPPG